MKSKFMIATLTLVSKLMDIPKHLRDCNADIVEFAKLFAEHLIGSGPPKKAALLPWDFVNEWNNTVEDQKCAHVDNFSGICTATILIPISCLKQADKMMPIFAEDLCGKEFAEVAVLYRDGLHQPMSDEARSKLVAEKNEELAKGAGLGPVEPCHSFPPEKPVMISEFEHFPPPPGIEHGRQFEC